MSARNRLENKRTRRLEAAKRKHRAAGVIPFGGVVAPGAKLNPHPRSLDSFLLFAAMLRYLG